TCLARQKLPALVGQVLENGPGLEQGEGFTAIGRRMIDDSGDAVVRRDLEKLGSKLLALADMHRDDAVLQSGLLEKDADLVAIGCSPVVQVDHLLASIGILTRLTRPWVDSSACRIRANQAPKAVAPQQTVGRQVVAVARGLVFAAHSDRPDFRNWRAADGRLRPDLRPSAVRIAVFWIPSGYRVQVGCQHLYQPDCICPDLASANRCAASGRWTSSAPVCGYSSPWPEPSRCAGGRAGCTG